MKNTKLHIDLAELLKQKHPNGFHAPADIDIDTFLEFADDEWEHELDVHEMLACERKTAVIISADEVRRDHPHLTDAQAWEIAEVVRDQTQDALEDFIGDTVWMNYPSERMKLRDRIFQLRQKLNGRDETAFRNIATELQGLARLLNREDNKASDDPAICGAVAATLDDIEAMLNKEGGAA